MDVMEEEQFDSIYTVGLSVLSIFAKYLTFR